MNMHMKLGSGIDSENAISAHRYTLIISYFTLWGSRHPGTLAKLNSKVTRCHGNGFCF